MWNKGKVCSTKSKLNRKSNSCWKEHYKTRRWGSMLSKL